MMAKCLASILFCVSLLVSGASAAPPCGDPTETWQTATPSEVDLDAEKLQAALDFATSRTTFSMAVFRRGCLVAESRLDPLTRDQTFESFSMAKSITSMVVGRAATLGYVSVEAPVTTVGEWITEAAAAHAAIPITHLLTMSSGLHWNFLRDYNVGRADFVADALDLPFDHHPGEWFEYHQTPVALLAEVVSRAVQAGGPNQTLPRFDDFQDFADRELFSKVGIPRERWTWTRDQAGHTAGFYGVQMRARDFARLGHLMLRHGSWDGAELIASAYVVAATTPSAANPTYGYLFWLNRPTGGIMPTIYDRHVFPAPQQFVASAPADAYSMSGFQDQRVYVIPSLDLVIVRLGVRGSISPDTRESVFTSAPRELEHELARRIGYAVTDVTIQDPGPYDRTQGSVPDLNPDYGLLRSLVEVDDWLRP